MFIIIYGLLNIIDKSVNQPFYSIQKERRYKWGRLLFSDWHKLLIQAADTLSPILQNICELSYPLSPATKGQHLILKIYNAIYGIYINLYPPLNLINSDQSLYYSCNLFKLIELEGLLYALLLQ